LRIKDGKGLSLRLSWLSGCAEREDQVSRPVRMSATSPTLVADIHFNPASADHQFEIGRMHRHWKSGQSA
jgi:hypothetical protein